MHRICVFCGSRDGNHPAFRAVARETGRLLGERGFALVYGGGSSGLMGAVANACLDADGSVIGVIPHFMDRFEVVHPELTDLRMVDTMHQRKALMCELADAFIALPGGIGTYEELLEQMAWFKLEQHRKPIGIVDTEGFYQPFLDLLRHTCRNGFYADPDLDQLRVADHPAALLDSFSPSPPKP